MNKTKKCQNCEEKAKNPLQHDGEYYCSECYHEKFIHCDRCSDVIELDSSHYHKDEYFCERCFHSNHSHCTHCNEIENHDNLYTAQGGDDYCEDCFYDLHTSCERCEDYYGTEEMNYIDERYICNDCNRETRIIKSYSYTPNPIFHTSKNERNYDRFENSEKRLVFGFELEVENKSREFSNEECAKRLKEIGGDLIYFKEDSSIDYGFEIVSHPMTYDYFKSKRAMFDNLLENAVKLGLRSYNTSTCGLHISICRKAFSHSHYLKFINFFNANRNHNLLKVISQRKDSQLNRWCALSKFSNKNELIKLSKVKNNGQTFERYLALNLQNSDRLEIRLFRGTLKLDSFFKAFETVFSIFDFCKQMSFKALEISSSKKLTTSDEIIKKQNLENEGRSIAQITPNLIQKRYFNTFIHKNKKQYKNLDLFLTEKYSSYYNCDKSEGKLIELNQILNQRKGDYFLCV